MIIVAFIVSGLVTGALLAVFARTQGVEHNGILAAIAVMGAGIQMIVLIAWYLHHTSERVRRAAASRAARQDPSAETFDLR